MCAVLLISASYNGVLLIVKKWFDVEVEGVCSFYGSGNLGSFILKALTENDFNTTVISRQSSNIFFLPQIKVFRIGDSYPQDELLAAFRGQDAVVVSTSPRGSDAQYRMVDAAVLAGVRRFIPSHWGSNAENRAVVELQSRLAAKAEIVEYLKTKESTGLTWTSVVPGVLIDIYLGNGLLGFDFASKEATIWGSGDERFSAGTNANTGTAVAKILLHHRSTANRYIYVSAIETTQNDILASLQRQTDLQPWKVKHESIEELLKSSREGIVRGDPKAAGYLTLVGCFGSDYGSDFDKEGKLDNKLLDLVGPNLDSIIADTIFET